MPAEDLGTWLVIAETGEELGWQIGEGWNTKEEASREITNT